MSRPHPFALLANATSIPWREVPEWPVPELVEKTAAELDRGARLCAWFGVSEDSGTRLVAVVAFDADSTLAVARSTPAEGEFPSLTVRHPQAHLFEREIRETRRKVEILRQNLPNLDLSLQVIRGAALQASVPAAQVG